MGHHVQDHDKCPDYKGVLILGIINTNKNTEKCPDYKGVFIWGIIYKRRSQIKCA